jgi:hypothetical protein
MTQDNPLRHFSMATLRTVDEWESAIAKTIPTDDMLNWFSDVLDTHIAEQAIRPGYLNMFCGAQKRFREVAHFSRKLAPEQRQSFIAQADTIIDLIRGLWGGDSALMERLDTALAGSADYYRTWGWPSPLWDVSDFDEL